jgi:hypothetical protein
MKHNTYTYLLSVSVPLIAFGRQFSDIYIYISRSSKAPAVEKYWSIIFGGIKCIYLSHILEEEILYE